MKSTGNDIIDLTRINKERTNLHKFYSKILAPVEQQLYHQPQFSTLAFDQYVWLLWSVKESAYKYYKRTNPELVYSPTRIIASEINLPIPASKSEQQIKRWSMRAGDDDLFSGIVVYESNSLHFRSKVTETWIATVVDETSDFQNVSLEVGYIEDGNSSKQSAGVRELLLNMLKDEFNGPLEVATSKFGYPVIYNGKEVIPNPVSLSHDGCYISYSYVHQAIIA